MRMSRSSGEANKVLIAVRDHIIPQEREATVYDQEVQIIRVNKQP